MRPTDSQDDKPSIGSDLTVSAACLDDEVAGLVIEPPTCADAIEATVRRQIAELRAAFASATPDVAERLAALALKESALSGGASQSLLEHSPQCFSPTDAIATDPDEHPANLDDNNDAEDASQAFRIETPIVSFAWSGMSYMTASVDLATLTASAPARAEATEAQISEAAATCANTGEDDATPPASSTAPGMIEAVVEPTTTIPGVTEDDTLGVAEIAVAPTYLPAEDQRIPEDVDLGYLALYEELLPAPHSNGGTGQTSAESVSESCVDPIAEAPAPAIQLEQASAIETETAEGNALAPIVVSGSTHAKIVDLPKTAPSTWGHPITRPAAVDQWTYQKPDIGFLAEPPEREGPELTEDILEETAGRLEKTIRDFGVKGEVIHVHPGPVVTLYEFEPAPGTKSSRVIALSEDIARSMSAVSARVAVIPGRNAIGIELPNDTRETVYLRELLASGDFETSKHKLPLCLGKTIGGEAVIADLARMPHLLVAGTTGSGKSVAINTMILSLLYRFTPEECRLIMVDPKMLELSVYDGIPHLLTPVVTDPKKAIIALRWAVREMEDRYKKMARLGVRNIDGFNARVSETKARGEVITRAVQTGFDKATGELTYTEEGMDLTPLPYIVVIVDEMADLMMVAGKEIEGAIQRLAQMARAAGIHVILATQRPSVDVITGTIKANFPTRISFQVTSKIDSRTILGEMGAEQLLGQGDMLHMQGGGRIARVHGPFVSDEEVERVVAHLKRQAKPVYLDAVTAEVDEEQEPEDTPVFDDGEMGTGSGELYDQAVSIVLRHKKASTSYIQRRLQIGYNRAASIMERMEKEGVVGPANHASKREILIGMGGADED
jgi:S-DNA-T family DNA segregation ATPase FtsK/SpoIIIE